MKRISAIIICLLMFLTCTLTGCAGFSINKVKYYNEVVATVGETKITRFELLNTYNSNSSYYSQNGTSESQALNEVLDLMINREALYQYALNYKPTLGANPYLPTRYQINEIVKSIFDSVDEQLEEHITNAKQILDIETSEESEAEEQTSATPYKRSDYDYEVRASIVQDGTKTVYYKDLEHTELADAADIKAGNAYAVEEPNFVIKYKTQNEPDSFEELIDGKFLDDYTYKNTSGEGSKDIVEEIKNKYLEHLHEKLIEAEKENAASIQTEILKSLSNSLINFEYYLRDENGKPYNKVQNDLLYRYFKRTFEAQIKSQFLVNFQEYYLEHENLSLNKLIQAYQEIATHDYNKYYDFSADYKADMKNTSTDFEKIFYHPNIDDDAQFGYFLHTLFQFSDEQKTEIENLTKQYDNKTFKEYAEYYQESLKDGKLDELSKQTLTNKFNEYKTAYTAIVLNTKAVVRNINDGTETDSTTLRQVLEGEYDNLVKTHDIYEFVDFMFKHTQDTATLTADVPYVVGSYDASKGETYSTNSSMEEAFTEEAIKLMKSGLDNSISDLYTENEFDVEKFCITSYGVHILYYICPVYEYDISYANVSKVYLQTKSSNKDFDPTGQFNLSKKYMNPLSELKGKTYFDLLFDIVYPASDSAFTTNTNYSEYEKSLAELAKTEYKVVKYSDKIKSTRTKI